MVCQRVIRPMLSRKGLPEKVTLEQKLEGEGVHQGNLGVHQGQRTREYRVSDVGT